PVSEVIDITICVPCQGSVYKAVLLFGEGKLHAYIGEIKTHRNKPECKRIAIVILRLYRPGARVALDKNSRYIRGGEIGSSIWRRLHIDGDLQRIMQWQAARIVIGNYPNGVGTILPVRALGKTNIKYPGIAV